MRTRMLAVTIDCREAEALAAFWKEALGYPETERWTDSHGLTYLELKSPETYPWVVMTDPEGNEFCVLPRR